MFNNTINRLLISSAILVAGLPSAFAAESCMPIGGVGMTNFVVQADGSFAIVAPLTGGVSNAGGLRVAPTVSFTSMARGVNYEDALL